jgi:hypothetical protein
VARHIFQACSVWIHTQSNITHIILLLLYWIGPKARRSQSRISTNISNEVE